MARAAPSLRPPRAQGRHTMFHCEVCGTLVSAKTPALRVVLETRARIYPARAEIHLKVPTPPTPSKNKPRRSKANKPRKPEWKNDPGRHGFEIVLEVCACSNCAEKHAAPHRAT